MLTLVLNSVVLSVKMAKSMRVLIVLAAAAAATSHANCIFDTEDNLECSVRTLNDGSGGLQEDYDVAGGRARAIRVACVEQFFSESHLKSGHFGNLVRLRHIERPLIL